MPRKTPSPYDEDPGFAKATKNEYTNGWLVLYDGDEAGFNTDSGRWHVLCTDHGSMVTETNKVRAQKILQTPAVWCSVCKRRHEDKNKPLRPVSMARETDESRDREKRFWAKKAKNNPEKCRLFEQMYGVKPDEYWD